MGPDAVSLLEDRTVEIPPLPEPEMTSPPIPPEPPPAPRPRLHPLLRSILFLVAFLAVQVGVTVGIVGIAHLVGGAELERLAGSSEALLLVFALTAVPLVAITKLFLRFLDRRPLSSLGVRWPVGGRRAALRQLVTLPLGTLAVVGCWLLLIRALPDALAAIHVRGLSPDLAKGLPGWPLPPVLLFLLFLLLFIVQGGIEEWVVRGYVYHALRERWRPFSAALVSSVTFGLLHLTNPDVSAAAVINVVLAGLVLNALVERSGSLWGATIAHGVWNFVLSCLVSLPVSGFPMFHLLNVSLTGNPLVTGDGFGPEGSLVLTALGLLLTALLWWRMPRRPSLQTVEDGLPPVPSPPEDSAPAPLL
jgi:CAAX protease family protein